MLVKVWVFLKNSPPMLTKTAFIWSKNIKRVQLWNIITILNNYFVFEYILECNVFSVMQNWIFSIVTPVFSVSRFFRNHSNCWICCWRNISYYYQCWKQMCCLIFLWEPWYMLFKICWWIESLKEQHLFENVLAFIRKHLLEIFCNI